MVTVSSTLINLTLADIKSATPWICTHSLTTPFTAILVTVKFHFWYIANLDTLKGWVIKFLLYLVTHNITCKRADIGG